MITVRELASRSGATVQRIRELIMHGLLTPEVKAKNRGGRNLFSENAVDIVKRIEQMKVQGIKRSTIRLLMDTGNF